MILFLDTTSFDEVYLALIDTNQVRELKFTASGRLSEELPGRIKNWLKQEGCTVADIEGIAVAKEAESFMSTRTGVATANALAWALGKPILGLERKDIPSDLRFLLKDERVKGHKPISPHYKVEPNITISRKQG